MSENKYLSKFSIKDEIYDLKDVKAREDLEKLNIDTLSKLSENDGTLLFNGNEINVDTTEKNYNTVMINYEDYSEEEKVIGKWTNGKPIYRKLVIQRGVSSKGSTQKFIHGIENIDSTISINKSFYKGGEEGTTIPFNIYRSGSYAACSYSFTPEDVSYFLEGWKNGDVYWIFEYTKTTDAENSFDSSMIFDTGANEATEDDVLEVLG